MVPVFDLNKLSLLLKDFNKLTGIRISVFDIDYNDLISYPENMPPVCSLIRASEKGSAACRKCDRKACELSANQKKMRIYRCHAGFTEVVSPLFFHGILIGYLMIGHFMEYSDIKACQKAVIARCKELELSDDVVLKALEEQKPFTRSHIISAARILQAVSYYVVFEQLATIIDEDMDTRLNHYIESHLDSDLSVPTICRDLNISKSQLYKVSTGLYGGGIATQIRTMRIERAKKLMLENPSMSVADIAAACGFSDSNYFITVFTKETGITPGRFRKLP